MTRARLLHLPSRVVQGQNEAFPSSRTQNTVFEGLKAGCLQQQGVITIAVGFAHLAQPFLYYLLIWVVKGSDVQVIMPRDMCPTFEMQSLGQNLLGHHVEIFFSVPSPAAFPPFHWIHPEAVKDHH